MLALHNLGLRPIVLSALILYGNPPSIRAFLQNPNVFPQASKRALRQSVEGDVHQWDKLIGDNARLGDKPHSRCRYAYCHTITPFARTFLWIFRARVVYIFIYIYIHLGLHRYTSISMELHGFAWNYMDLHGIIESIISHGE